MFAYTKKTKYIIPVFLILINFIFVNIVSAQTVNLIEPIPGGNTLVRGPGLLTTYLSLVFNIALSVAAILALLFIVLGGVRYTLSAISPSEKGAAKTMIFNAIWGLLIVLLAFIILKTINPDLVSSSFSLPFIN